MAEADAEAARKTRFLNGCYLKKRADIKPSASA